MGIYTFTTSDLTTSSLTAIDVPQMTFPLTCNAEVWSFDFQLIIGSNSIAGLRIALTVPLGAAFRAWAIGSGATRNGLIVDPMSVSGTLGTPFNTFSGTQNFLQVRGGIRNGGFGGSVQLQVAKVTSGTATLHAGSFFIATPL